MSDVVSIARDGDRAKGAKIERQTADALFRKRYLAVSREAKIFQPASI